MTTRVEFQRWLDQFPENTEIDVIVGYRSRGYEGDSFNTTSFTPENVPKETPDSAYTKSGLKGYFVGETFEYSESTNGTGQLLLGIEK